jgi:hypothetical protein
LRLDGSGFEVSAPFRKRKFRWGEVSDFGVVRQRASSSVVFKAATPRPDVSGALTSILAMGRINEWLPDTYGFAAEDLAQLMTIWQNSAMQLGRSGSGTPVDVTLSELALATFFPADDLTARRMREMAAALT